MNRYTFEEIEMGQEEHFSVRITEEQTELFRKITGDVNPLHSDGEYARREGYDGPVAFGMLTTSFLSTLAGVYLPGENSLIYDVNASYTRPVYVGDVLTVSGEVADKNATMSMITIRWRIVNQQEDVAARGKMRVQVRNNRIGSGFE